MNGPALRLATRGSPLALWQAERVAHLLRRAHRGLGVELVTVSTSGDRMAQTPVWEMGGQGVFVREVQVAVLEDRADAAVHSAKDLQPVPTPGLVLTAFPERADPRDALVGSPLASLGPGCTVATGSQRRRAQLAAARPGLVFQSLRGNIATRLGQVPPRGAIVVARAALERLGLQPEPMETLPFEVMLPQVGQGALAVECRQEDAVTAELLAPLDDPGVRGPVGAERAFLAALGGGCTLPVAGHARLLTEPPGTLVLEALVATTDGSVVLRRSATGMATGPEELGRRVADLVLEGGGADLLGRQSGPLP